MSLNDTFSAEDESAAADRLWDRLRALHESGTLLGCSHRCSGVDHVTDDVDLSGSRARATGNDDDEMGESAGEGVEEAEETSDQAAAKAAELAAAKARLPVTRLRCVSKAEALRDGGRGVAGGAEAPIKGYGILQRHAYALIDMKVRADST